MAQQGQSSNQSRAGQPSGQGGQQSQQGSQQSQQQSGAHGQQGSGAQARAQGQGGRGGDVSVVQVQQHLRGIDYPCGKQGVLDAARSNDASQEVIDTLSRLPDQQFGSRPTCPRRLAASSKPRPLCPPGAPADA